MNVRAATVSCGIISQSEKLFIVYIIFKQNKSVLLKAKIAVSFLRWYIRYLGVLLFEATNNYFECIFFIFYRLSN